STKFTGRTPGAGGNRLAKSRRRATLAPPLRRSAAWMADRARPTRNSMKRSCKGTGLSRLLHGVNRGQIGTGAAFRQRPQPPFGLAALFHAVHGLRGLFHGPIGAHGLLPLGDFVHRFAFVARRVEHHIELLGDGGGDEDSGQSGGDQIFAHRVSLLEWGGCKPKRTSRTGLPITRPGPSKARERRGLFPIPSGYGFPIRHAGSRGALICARFVSQRKRA